VRIETERLLLRRVEAPDATIVAGLWSDPTVTRYMGGPRNFNKVRLEFEAEARRSTVSTTGWWPVVEKASGRVIGECGLIEKEVDGRGEIELVYVFAFDSWGKGFATEAALALRDYAFRRLGLRRIVALIDPENYASARVAEKIGMQFERETRRPSGRIMRMHSMDADQS
jgi:RimJ/RimL family protein N-acetyltransferase